MPQAPPELPQSMTPEPGPEPCSMIRIHPDADGDGHAATSESNKMWVCAGDVVPSGFATTPAMLQADCDDADASVWRRLCADRDLDGAVSEMCVGDEAPAGALGCPLVVEWTPEPGPYDCNDDDPELLDYFYRDLDDDGWGGGERICFREAEGYTAWGGDCADDDATRAPHALELFGDGQDNDCDGTDENSSCSGPLMEFDWPDVGEPLPDCEGPDLALGVLSCSGCLTSLATFAVHNRGNAPFVGDIVLSEVEAPISLELQPGEHRVLLSGPFRGQTTLGYASPNTVDCRSADNTVHSRAGHCI
jgi:hypothetical protein